ncbi:glycogenin-1-like isoform X5 [Contarinia nasturtii]|uniref:glycogenin-1-like isoform X5 n=1 Tax=Contarinia nasturtii TaxID=265458 RepID=UPI0012D3BAB5|nr:glycogenin-1-like isoform X5 [Contarinia nasturtii]
MGQFAWVTLATNDSYALGALVVANSLRKVNTAHQLAVLITPGVTSSMRQKLQNVFNLMQEVNVLDSKDAANLALLSRPELGITFTKLHCWRLTQYEKCVFLDADTLVLQNCDELFEREELSAAPDVGWPDCFNSGVYVFRPSLDTFEKLTQFAVQKGSFDGGDQGLLNSYFANWAQSDSSKRLPFIYNTCSTACYSYLPAFKQFGENVKILHFIGQLKPWVINFDPVAKKPNPPQEYKHLTDYLDLWWNIFCQDVHPKLVPDMNSNDQRHNDAPRWYENPQFLYVPPNEYLNVERTTETVFSDPWEEYYEKQNAQTEHMVFAECTENISADNYGNVQTSSEHTIHVDHEQVHVHSEQMQSQWHGNNSNNNNNTQQSVEHESAIEYESHSEHHHQHTHEQSTHSIIESTNQCSIPAEIVAIECNDHLFSTHEIIPSNDNFVPSSSQNNDHSEPSGNDNDDQGGLAGALAGLKLGVARSAEQEAYENNCRRSYWEHGNIDYLGKDSFDNIWKRITQTLESKNGSSSEQERRARTPTPQPEDKLPKDAKKEGVRRISDVSAPIATCPVTKNAAPIASFAPIQKSEVKTEVKQESQSEPKTETKLETSTEPTQGSVSTDTKPTVTIPPTNVESVEKPTTPTVTSPTPPQSPASASTQSKPLTVTKDLSAVHDIPDTPPAGGQKETAKLKKEAPKKKK